VFPERKMRMSTEFELLADGIGVGRPPAGWVAIVDMPVLILVGVTGVGKSTAVDALRTRWGEISLLPNRRKIADLLVIPTVQGWDGDPPTTVTDRRRRFDYTGRYRQRHPGGLAHAFSRLVLQRRPAVPGRGAVTIFDGLRGADEVSFAAQSLPLARFAVLNAPDVVRVERLLQRQDAFDQVSENSGGQRSVPSGQRSVPSGQRPVPSGQRPVPSGQRPVPSGQRPVPSDDTPDATRHCSSASDGGFRWEEVAEGQDLFTREEQDHLAALVSRGEVDGAELAAKIAIVAAERRNYDPYAAVEILRAAALDRTVVVDTTTHSPTEVAAKLERLLAN
jgi:hypothetical protein